MELYLYVSICIYNVYKENCAFKFTFWIKELVGAVAHLGDTWNSLLQTAGCIHHQLNVTLHRARQAMYVPVT